MESIDLLSEKFNLRIKRVHHEDCQLCIAGYTGKKCRYLLRINRDFYCVRHAATEIDSRLQR